MHMRTHTHTHTHTHAHTHTHTAPRSKATTKVKTEGKKEPESPTKLKSSLLDPVSVRANAKKALYQILWKRLACASIVEGERNFKNLCAKNETTCVCAFVH